MAYIAENRRNTISLRARLSEIYKDISAAYVAWRLYNRTLSELRGLSARELSDLGLSQASLRSAAYDAVYGKAA